MERRDFLVRGLGLLVTSGVLDLTTAQALAAAATDSISHSKLKSNGSARPFLVCADSKHSYDTYADPEKMTAVDVAGSVNFMDLTTGKVSSVEVPIWAHVYDQNPAFPHRVLGCAKWTSSAVYVDLKSKKILAHLQAPEGYRFFGHAVFSPDGKKAFISADSTEHGVGGLCQYDIESAKFERVVSAGIRKPHECIINSKNILMTVGRHSDDGKTLSPTVGGVSMIDWESGKVLKLYKTNRISHILELDSDTYSLSGGSVRAEAELGLLKLSTGDYSTIRSSPDYPKEKILSEALSMAQLSQHEIIATLPNLKKIAVWDFKQNRLKIETNEVSSWGLAAYNQEIYTNHEGPTEQTSGLARMRVSEFAKTKFQMSLKDPYLGNGRHMRLMMMDV